MERFQKIHESKPYPYLLDTNANMLMEILSMIELQSGHEFAFVGGFVRDYGKRPYNDFDICTRQPDYYREKLLELGYLRTSEHEVEGGTIQHDYFLHPYELGVELPIHFIHTRHELGFPPDTFDFSINEFALKSDMLLYAPTYAWKDAERRILRLNKQVSITTNVVMRATRFASKLGFTMHVDTERRIRQFLSDEEVKIASNRVLTGIDKMVEDGVEAESFQMLKDLGFPKVDEYDDINEFRQYHNDLILLGNAHVDVFTRHGAY